MGPNSGAPIHDDDWFKEKDYRAEESKEPLISPNKVTESGKKDDYAASPEDRDRKIGQELID